MSIVSTSFLVPTQILVKTKKKTRGTTEDDLENIINDTKDGSGGPVVPDVRRRWIATTLFIIGSLVAVAVIIIIGWTVAYPVMKNV